MDSLLLLDLDGVVVFECGPPLLETLEILRLHQGLAGRLAAIEAPVVVLTHRSRREARHILHVAGVADGALAGLIAAEDLFVAGLRHAPVALFSRGLRKSLILPVLERRYGTPRARFALIDDRLDNLRDLLGVGIGLGLLAPSAIDGDRLETFDFNQATSYFAAWATGERPGGLVPLTASLLLVENWRRTGLDTTRRGRHVFNLARALGRRIRQRATGRD